RHAITNWKGLAEFSRVLIPDRDGFVATGNDIATGQSFDESRLGQDNGASCRSWPPELNDLVEVRDSERVRFGKDDGLTIGRQLQVRRSITIRLELSLPIDRQRMALLCSGEIPKHQYVGVSRGQRPTIGGDHNPMAALGAMKAQTRPSRENQPQGAER